MKLKRLISIIFIIVIAVVTGSDVYANESIDINNDECVVEEEVQVSEKDTDYETQGVVSIEDEGSVAEGGNSIDKRFSITYKYGMKWGNKKVTTYFKVVKVSGKIPSGKINLYLYNKKTGDLLYTKQAEKENIKVTSTTNVSVSKDVTATRFWKMKLKGSVGTIDINGTKKSGLLNRKANKYPAEKEVYTKRVPEVPPTNLKKDPNERERHFRDNYIKWFEKKYPKANVTWSNYEIHHVRPLAYGGSNDISNGIALKPEQHRKYTTWWVSY